MISYYDLSVLSVTAMGFQKTKSLDGGGWVGGWGEQVYLGFLNF